MQIQLENISKKYNRQWIFKSISLNFERCNTYGIIGSNGGGKSTLLKIISGIISPNEGELSFLDNGKKINLNELNPFLSIVAPYMELPAELKLKELYYFQESFRSFSEKVSQSNFFSEIQLEGKEEELVKNLSSGMKQRLKLGLALLSNTKVILLDEPCSNLDERGRNLYKSLIKKADKALIIIASNSDEEELIECKSIININHFKE